MTQPFDPLNPANATIGVRQGMFADSTRCPNPGCGFASSDQGIYECPSCGTMWRKRPEKQQPVNVTPAGTRVALVCVICEGDFSAGSPPVFDGAGGLAHEACLLQSATARQQIARQASDAPDYLSIVQDEKVVPAEKTMQPARKKRRRRKRKPASQGSYQQPQPRSEAPASEDTQEALF